MSASRTFRFLTAAQIEQLHKRYINSSPRILQPSYLQSAAYGPINAKHYGQQQDVFELAANLSEKIIKNHAFLDGNKRTAMVAADTFLKMNGFQLQIEPMACTELNNDFVQAHLAVVTNQWTVRELAGFYRRVATSFDTSNASVTGWRNEAEEH